MQFTDIIWMNVVRGSQWAEVVNKQDRIHIFHCLYQHYLTQTHAHFSILLVDNTVSIEF